MLPTQKTDAMKLGVDVDNASFDRLEQRLQVLDDKLLILRRTNDAWAKSSSMTAESITAAYQKAGDQVSRLSQIMAAAKSQAAGNYNNLRNELMGGGEASGGAQQATGGGFRLSPRGMSSLAGAFSGVGLDALVEPTQRLGNVAEIAKTASEGLAAVGVSLGGVAAVAAPVAAGVALIALAMHDIQQKSQPARDALDSIIRTQDGYYKFIQTATTKQVQAQIDALNKETENYRKQQTENESIIRGFVLSPNFRSTYSDAELQKMSGADMIKMFDESITVNLDPTIKAAIDKFKELAPKISDDNTLVGRFTGLILSNSQAANDAAEAEKKLRDARLASIDQNISKEMEYIKLINTGASKDITSQIRDKWNEVHQIETAMLGLENSSNEDDKAKYAELKKRRQDDLDSIGRLTDKILPEVKAREAETSATEKSNAVSKKTREDFAKQNEALAGEYEKHGENVQNIIQNDLEARASIEQKYQDALVKAAEDAVQAATAALQKLEEQRNDLRLSLNRDLNKAQRDAADQALTDQIKAQRQERDDLVAHLRRLQEIRSQNQAGEQQAIWDRNALELIRLRLTKTQQMDAENTAFQQKRADEIRQAEDQSDDQKRQQAIQRRERLIAYAEANGDAEKQYRRELDQEAAAKERAIQLAAAGKAKEIELEDEKVKRLLSTENQRAVAEMKLITTVADVRIKALQAEAGAARKMIGAAAQMPGSAEEYRRSASQSSGGSAAQKQQGYQYQYGAVTRAGGGPVQAGQMYQVNDDVAQHTESFNGVPFPSGLGIFIPAQSGYVQSSKTVNHSLTLNVPINGVTDPQAVARIAVPLIQREIIAFADEVFGDD